MGYETTLLVVDGNGRKSVGYHNIVATVELSKVAYDAVGDIIESKKDDKDLSEQVREWEESWKETYTLEGDYNPNLQLLSESEKSKKGDKVYSVEQKLSKKLPYVFYSNGNKQDFVDDYGSLLKVVEVKDIYNAILQDQAKMIKEDGEGYRRFDIALKVLEGFMNDKWNVKVILWGH